MTKRAAQYRGLDHRLLVLMTTEQRDAVNKAAQAEGTNVSAWIRDAIEQKLGENDDK